MWTLTGDFDGSEMITEVSGVEKTKLLKTGKTYALGRKEALLNINIKKISRNHGIFTVGKFTEDHVMDPETRPTLQYTNTNQNESRVVHVQRGDDHLPINVQSTFDLEDGDIVSVASRVLITVRWHVVCCYQQAAKGKSGALTLASCAALGIHLVHTPVPQITHHITTTFAATTLHAFSLVISAAFVKPEWLNEVIRLGNLPLNSDPSSGLSLEQVFDLPPVNKYRPTFNASLAAEHKTVRIWDPNEERMSMFSAYRFYCMGEGKRQIDSDLREVITRAAGKIETLNVAGSNASEKFSKALTRCRAKTDQKLVLIADQEACQAAVGKDGWQKVAKHAPSFDLRFFAPQDIIQAILDADASILDPPDMWGGHANIPSSSPLPNVIPNTHPEENSIPDEEPEQESEPELPPPRKLTRRVSSRQASQEPKPVEEAPAPPRRHLTRRAQPTGQPVITGLDDPSVLLNNLPETSVVIPAPVLVDTSRRVGTSAAPDPGTLISDAIVSGFEPDPEEERPLKKFKALFEASDPKNSGAESFVQESGAFDDDELAMMANVGSQSQTQLYTQTQSGGSRTTRGGRGAAAALRAVREEEEEETQMAIDEAGPTDLGKKRKERSFDGDDVEMAGVENVLNDTSGSSVGNGPVAKKQAVAGNAVERTVAKQPSAVATAANAAKTKSLGKKDTAATAGAMTGKPDTDTAFLKAIASTKRGKKTEDEFDRDFNKLKISKSGLRDDEQEQRPDWELMETFGDESNLLGNFMVIQDLEVFKTETGPRKRAVTADPRYEGKPDWKKFKKNKSITAAPREKIALFAPEENDAGLGRGYWKSTNSPPRSEDNNDDFGPTQKQTQATKKVTQAPKASRAKAKSQAIADDSDEDEIAPKAKGKRSKPPSKAEPPKKRATRGASKVPDSPAALFIKDSDDDDEAGGTRTLDEDDFDGGQTLQSSAETGPARRSGRATGATKKKAAPIIVDDDSDNEGKFTGWAKQKAKARR
ncbi:proline-rich protein [Mycena alexandri]|uniref:Proline-rich protein n=1 Tax=Mycena alexandri TaxID=1745969 RepID=A0AAD6SE84_9AGAR|nr:proline-rich protein [Mycena alexandri]